MNRRADHRWSSRRARSAFTLIELIVVMAIIIVVLGLVAFLPDEAKRDGNVQAAAQELMATLRQARSLAMDRRAIYAVTFNIENAPGSSGRVLNNHSGQHWYQILGPSISNADMNSNGAPMVPYPEAWWAGGQFNVSQWQQSIGFCYTGDRHFLKARKVRFLALSDQDNGFGINTADWNSQDNTFPPSYPRPWCGYWDPSSKRLFPWGGYDTSTMDSWNRHCGGFYYEGRDGAITGCVNPATRTTTVGAAFTLYQKGAARPLINGLWEDFAFLFYPDGTISQAFLPGRTQSWSQMNNGGGAAPGDLGDRATQEYWFPNPTTNFTGAWYITLCPDTIQDSDVFPSAQDAYTSITPAYRVSVNAVGVISVVRVRPFLPAGSTLDDSISNWQDPGQLQQWYYGNRLTNPDHSGRGTPIEAYLTPYMLSQRSWWLK
jgi:prepilin-type N-terminal cleavage/methylation domain-containing protein